jgi:tRNA-binding protein
LTLVARNPFEITSVALATVEEFLSLDMRVGTIMSARVLKGARRPSFALSIDFGELGLRSAVAAIADLYELDELVGLQVVGVVNLPPHGVAGLETTAVVLTVSSGKGEVVLLLPDQPVPDGTRVAG